MLHRQIDKKNKIWPKNSFETPYFGFEKFEKAQFLSINRPGGPLKVKMGTVGDVQMVAGVPRDILTKFQGILSSRFESHLVLVNF